MSLSPETKNDHTVHDDFDEPAPLLAAAVWPPQPNGFMMIGQHSLVETLRELIAYCQSRKKRFPDRILVGSAGLGKSSLARAIARDLTGGQCLLFNGSDITDPGNFIDAVADHGLFDDELRDGLHVIDQCIVFIDEAHALRRRLIAWLLSALDDTRETTHEGKRYSFENVSFILATTDPGKLPETFRTRADTVNLRPYSLEEIAGIVWIHGKDLLEGYELPRDVCIELGARVRANPRRAVRALRDAIIPHAHCRLADGGDEQGAIGPAITVELVANYFDRQGIDVNGLDGLAISVLRYLDLHGSTPENRLCQAVGISNKNDFLVLDEYLARLGLIRVTTRGRDLTTVGKRYVHRPFALRGRITNTQSTEVPA